MSVDWTVLGPPLPSNWPSCFTNLSAGLRVIIVHYVIAAKDISLEVAQCVFSRKRGGQQVGRI